MPILRRWFPAALLSLALLALAGAALFLNGHPFPAAQAQTTTPTTTDYDSDDDGLIEISNLAQLNAIRWDLNGDGKADVSANHTRYTAAFPNPAAGLGCPDGADADTHPDPCLGYELKADLTFDTNGDGSVNSSDSGGLYWNGGAGWTPIGSRGNPYTGEFQGRGKTITGLFISNESAAMVGLFGAIGPGGSVADLGLPHIRISSSRQAAVGALAGVNEGTITASYATGAIAHLISGSAVAGGLVGINLFGTVQASFADVGVSPSHGDSVAGGLVGQNLLGAIKASYALGLVRANAVNSRAGGLVGVNQGDIEASYARGPVTATGHNSYAGGLVGYDLGRETASYWDTVASGRTVSAGGLGQSSSELQSPTGYTGIYAQWNLNLDENAGGDNPWNFGGGHQYPILVYGTMAAAPQRDHDADDDRLIEVSDLAQLNAIRWDLNGDGAVAAADKANYAAAFPGLTAGMGCPDGTDADTKPDPCLGYELMHDLDFDTTSDGSVTIADSGGLYWNSGAGWTPLGSSTAPFTGTFQGNSKTIANLFINQTNPARVGLFGEVGSTGKIEGARLEQVNIRTQNGSRVGALAGVNGGAIKLSSAAGSIDATEITATGYVGGLVGGNAGNILTSYARTEISGSGSVVGGLAGHNGTSGSITASYSAVFSAVTSRNSAYLGGLVGHNQGSLTATYSRTPVKATGNTVSVGGLVGYNQQTDSASTTQGIITASYAVGPVVATGTSPSAGGLVGKNSNGSAPYSYWDGNVSGQVNSPLGSGILGHDESTYTGKYAQWNLNLDGVAGGDDPWLFAHRQYPILKYGGMDVARQVQFYIWDPPAVGRIARSNWHIGEWLTRAPGTAGLIWDRSADGVTGWTVIRYRQLGIGAVRGGGFQFLIEPYEAGQRFRVRRRSVERGWVYGYISPPARPWSGPTATLTFASGGAAPRVGQSISISGTDNVRWIRCDDTADNGCDVIVAAATSYTPVAADQGKYLYAYRYYNDSQGVRTMGKTGYIGPVAAASPSS